MFCVNEIDQAFEKLNQGITVFSYFSIEKYVKCAKEQNLIAQYFPVVESGFILYKEKIIFMIAEDGGTKFSMDPI